MRPTWVVGDGHNFVRTMAGLAGRGIAPTVVADQIGRPTFADDIADAIVHLLDDRRPTAPSTSPAAGSPRRGPTWRARSTRSCGADLTVTDTTTAEYFADKPDAAPRPLNSVLDLEKAAAAGVALPDWRERLKAYVTEQAR